MNVREIKPAVDADALLAGAQFADAFGLDIDGRTLDARQAAERMMARAPRWIDALLALRNILVAPFGLKTSGAGATAHRDMIGIFPVISQTPDRLVAGRGVDLHARDVDGPGRRFDRPGAGGGRDGPVVPQGRQEHTIGSTAEDRQYRSI